MISVIKNVKDAMNRLHAYQITHCKYRSKSKQIPTAHTNLFHARAKFLYASGSYMESPKIVSGFHVSGHSKFRAAVIESYSTVEPRL